MVSSILVKISVTARVVRAVSPVTQLYEITYMSADPPSICKAVLIPSFSPCWYSLRRHYSEDCVHDPEILMAARYSWQCCVSHGSGQLSCIKHCSTPINSYMFLFQDFTAYFISRLFNCCDFDKVFFFFLSSDSALFFFFSCRSREERIACFWISWSGSRLGCLLPSECSGAPSQVPEGRMHLYT